MLHQKVLSNNARRLSSEQLRGPDNIVSDGSADKSSDKSSSRSRTMEKTIGVMDHGGSNEMRLEASVRPEYLLAWSILILAHNPDGGEDLTKEEEAEELTDQQKCLQTMLVNILTPKREVCS